MTELIEFCEDSGIPFNVQKSFGTNHEKSKTVVILTSGKLSSLSSTGGEFRVIEEIIDALSKRSYTVYRIEFVERDVERNFASSSEIESRKNRIIKLLNVLASETIQKINVIGFSLGGSIFLNLLSKSVLSKDLSLKNIFFVGVTLESSLVINYSNFEMHFIYGEKDFIGLVSDSTDEVIIQDPKEYAPISMRNLILMNDVKVFQNIIEGQNHLLTIPEKEESLFSRYILSNLS